MRIKTNCRHYKGDTPCKFHKKEGVKCHDCPYYERLTDRILIIKLGALGDVIRTTPLLRKLRRVFPKSEIAWLTYYPEVLPEEYINNILKVNIENIVWLQTNTFDWLINLDKARLAISLTKTISAKKKSGFIIDGFGKCKPISNKEAKKKWLMGVEDELSRKNQKNYLEETFRICGFSFQGEEYIVEDKLESQPAWNINYDKKIIGLNTGGGELWKAKLWPEEHWIELARRLREIGSEVILLGGEKEHDKNIRISKLSGAKYFGYFGLKEFINLVNQCKLIVTCVTMCLHLAIGLKKKILLLNSTFNKNEFCLYNRGIILEPDIECKCYYSVDCPKQCMRYLSVDKVYKNIKTN